MFPGVEEIREGLGEEGDDCINKQDVRVAGGTLHIETGQLLIIKRCVCLICFL